MKLALAVLVLALAVGAGWMLRPRPGAQRVELKWTVAKAAASDGKPHVLRIAQGARALPERNTLVWRLEVTRAFSLATPEGMPQPDALAQLDAEEGALVARVPGRLVLVDTGSGARTWTFYVADQAAAEKAQAVSGELKVLVEKDESWEAYPKL